jgi:hypothetical protein
MGNWNCYRYADDAWTVFAGPDEIPEVGDRDLRFFLADSDLAEVRYFPAAAPGTGSAFVGHTPRTYFDDPDAPGCTDSAADAIGLATWAANGVSAQQISALLAVDATEPSDTPVEETLDRLVSALGLPAVPW